MGARQWFWGDLRVPGGSGGQPGQKLEYRLSAFAKPHFQIGKTIYRPSPTARSKDSLTMTIVSDLLATDDLTILLALIAATTFLLNNLYRPQPLVHPILLGRQSDVGRARNPGESALYRNYGTGLMGRVRLCTIYVDGPLTTYRL